MVDGSLEALAKFLLSVIELLFLSLTVEAVEGKMCQNSLASGVGRSLGAKISGENTTGWVELSTSSIVFAMLRQCAHMGGHIGATWRIRLNRLSAALLRPYVKLLLPLIIVIFNWCSENIHNNLIFFDVVDCLFLYNFGVNMQELTDLARFLNIPPAHLSTSGNLAVNNVFNSCVQRCF